MSYQLRLEGTILRAVEYHKPGPYTRRSSSGMKRWMSGQLENDKHPIEVPGISFIQWLKLLKDKSLILDTI
jgi:hypothetical protein